MPTIFTPCDEHFNEQFQHRSTDYTAAVGLAQYYGLTFVYEQWVDQDGNADTRYDRLVWISECAPTWVWLRRLEMTWLAPRKVGDQLIRQGLLEFCDEQDGKIVAQYLMQHGEPMQFVINRQTGNCEKFEPVFVSDEGPQRNDIAQWTIVEDKWLVETVHEVQ